MSIAWNAPLAQAVRQAAAEGPEGFGQTECAKLGLSEFCAPLQNALNFTLSDDPSLTRTAQVTPEEFDDASTAGIPRSFLCLVAGKNGELVQHDRVRWLIDAAQSGWFKNDARREAAIWELRYTPVANVELRDEIAEGMLEVLEDEPILMWQKDKHPEDFPLQVAALSTLGAHRALPEEVLPVLHQHLFLKSSRVLFTTVWAAGEYGQKASALVPQLIKLALSEEGEAYVDRFPRSRMLKTAIVEALIKIGPKAIAYLIRNGMVTSSDSQEKTFAWMLIKLFAERADPVIEQLRKDSDAVVRREAEAANSMRQ